MSKMGTFKSKVGDYMKLQLRTFGEFDMLLDGESIVEDLSRSYKLFKLFQYFVTFKNKKLLPDTLIESLWQDQDSQDPKNMIRGQIFRLRQILKKSVPEDYLEIVFLNGYYSLEVGENVTVDTDEMEKAIQRGEEVYESDKKRAEEYYLKAIDYYKGSYLSEITYEMWLVPVKNYYKRLFLTALDKLISIYIQTDRHEDIVALCEKAVIVEPYEEKIYTVLIESLLKLSKIRQAYNQFKFMQLAFEKELGVTNTSTMKAIEKKIKNYANEKSDLSITEIEEKLNEKTNKGPLLVDAEYFKVIYSSYKRKRNQEGQNDYIGLFTLVDEEDEVDNVKWRKYLAKGFEATLRRGDIYTFWNDSQAIVLLTDVKNGGYKSATERLVKNSNVEKYKPYMTIKFDKIEGEKPFEILGK